MKNLLLTQLDLHYHFPYPTIEEVKEEWNQLYPPLRSGLENISSDALDAHPLARFDQVAKSFGELWAFINHHVAYHIGQIGILRRGFGIEAKNYS